MDQTKEKMEKVKDDEKIPIHKQWWFLLIVVIILIGLGYGGMQYMNKPATQAFAYYF
jgi:hypothetical protein